MAPTEEWPPVGTWRCEKLFEAWRCESMHRLVMQSAIQPRREVNLTTVGTQVIKWTPAHAVKNTLPRPLRPILLPWRWQVRCQSIASRPRTHHTIIFTMRIRTNICPHTGLVVLYRARRFSRLYSDTIARYTFPCRCRCTHLGSNGHRPSVHN